MYSHTRASATNKQPSKSRLHGALGESLALRGHLIAPRAPSGRAEALELRRAHLQYGADGMARQMILRSRQCAIAHAAIFGYKMTELKESTWRAYPTSETLERKNNPLR